MTDTRPIKFRAWWKDTKTMYLADQVAVRNNEVMVFYPHMEDQEWQDHSLNVQVMQFTGLLDKNGVEIYESDILKLDNDSLEDTIVDVKYDEEEATWIVGDGFESLSEALPECEVIGNIYENPELLAQKHNGSPENVT